MAENPYSAYNILKRNDLKILFLGQKSDKLNYVHYNNMLNVLLYCTEKCKKSV